MCVRMLEKIPPGSLVGAHLDPSRGKNVLGSFGLRTWGFSAECLAPWFSVWVIIRATLEQPHAQTAAHTNYTGVSEGDALHFSKLSR